MLISNSRVILFNNHNIFVFSTHSFLFFYPNYPSAHPHLSVISFSVLPIYLSKEDTNENENTLLTLIDFSPVFNFIFCTANHMTGFCIKCNTGLKWIKSFLPPGMLYAIQYHLYNLKRVNNTRGGGLLLVKLQARKVKFLQECFSRFLNCTNGTKSCKVSHIL